MKKLILILIAIVFCIPLMVIPTTVLSESGPPPTKEWKGEGKKIEFQSMPTMTVKDFFISTFNLSL